MESSPALFRRAATTALLGTPLPPPYTKLSLTANLVLRVSLSLLANAVCLAPLRVLYRHGEFAAAVFIANVELLNLEAVVNSLLWRNDHVAAWWAGWGFCDVVVHLHNACGALFITCLLAIMRNLAQQVGMMRTNPLTVNERRHRNLVQALIMFPLPVVQLAWTMPASRRRYEVGTLIGCSWDSHPSWPNLAFFVLPPIAIAFVTAGYAVLTYIRFRQVAKVTESALSSNQRASRRGQRTKRRLYLMVMSIVVPYLPVVVGLAIDLVTLADRERGQMEEQLSPLSSSVEGRPRNTGADRNPFPFRTRLDFPIPLRLSVLAPAEPAANPARRGMCP